MGGKSGCGPLPCFANLLKINTGWVPERLKGPVLKTGRRESVSWVRIPPHPPRLKSLITQYFSGSRRCGIRDSLRGFRATVHRPYGPVRQPSPVCGPPIPRISLSAVRVVRFAAPRRRASRSVTRSPSAFLGRRALTGRCQTNLNRPAKGAGLRRSNRELTPFGQSG